jgi:hypothetical protein
MFPAQSAVRAHEKAATLRALANQAMRGPPEPVTELRD